MSKGPTVSQRLANIKHMPTLVAATMAIEKPVEAYLLKDIVKMSYESPQTRVFLQDYFCNLLVSSKNVLVKLRVLQVLVVLVEEGHEEFKTNLQRQPDALKETSRLRSSNANVLADCGRIRDTANKILDMLFNEEWRRPPPRYVIKPPTAEESSGEVFPPATKSSSNFAKGIEIIASKMKIGPKSSKLDYDRDYAGVQSVPFNVQATPTPTQTYQGMGVIKQTDLPPTEEHVIGRPGGGWDVDPRSGQQDTVKQTAVVTPSKPPVEEVMPPPVSPTTEENRLVDDITVVGGVRMAPSRDQLQSFITRCRSLDLLTIVDLLRVKLASDNNSVVLRTLCVLEALLRSDIPDVSQVMDIALEELVQLQSSPQQAIKAKSTKIIRSLGMDSSQPLNNTVAKQPPTNQSNALVDFMGSDSPNVPPTSGTANPVETGNPPSNELDIFGPVGSTSEPSQPAANGDITTIFGNMQIVGNSQPSTTDPPGHTSHPIDNSLMDFGPEEDLELDPLAPKRTQSNASGFLTSSGNFNFGTVRQPSTSVGTATTMQNPLISIPANSYSWNTTGTVAPSQQTTMMYQPSVSGPQAFPQNSMGQTHSYYGMTTPPQQGYPQMPYQLAGQSRPVQRPPQEPTNTAGFGFIDKPTESSPFGFVGAEMMKASQKK